MTQWKALEGIDDLGSWIYCLKCPDETKSGYDFQIYNGADFFREILVESEVVSRCQQLNPALEATEDAIIEVLEDFLGNKSRHLQLEKAEYPVSLTLTMNDKLKSLGINFKWTFEMEPVTGSDLFQIMNKGLLASIHMLISQKEYLVKELESKDLEIEDFEESGYKLSQKSLKTEKFNREDLAKVGHLKEESVLSVLMSDAFGENLKAISSYDKMDPNLNPNKKLDSKRKRKIGIRLKEKIQILGSDESDPSDDDTTKVSKVTQPKAKVQPVSQAKKAKQKMVKKLKKL